MVTLHLGYLMDVTSTRFISSGSWLVIGGVGYAVSFLLGCLNTFLTEETD
jgi:hypothetical protein